MSYIDYNTSRNGADVLIWGNKTQYSVLFTWVLWKDPVKVHFYATLCQALQSQVNIYLLDANLWHVPVNKLKIKNLIQWKAQKQLHINNGTESRE